MAYRDNENQQSQKFENLTAAIALSTGTSKSECPVLVRVAHI